MADKDIPGVIAPPPLIFLSGLAAGIAADYAFGWSITSWGVPSFARWFAGASSLGLGILVMAAGISGFRRAGTPVPTRETTTALVTTGAHGLSRNPLYIGLFLDYTGLALLADSAGALALLLPIAIVMRHGVVAREEAYLTRKFGAEYEAYMARVPRWI